MGLMDHGRKSLAMSAGASEVVPLDVLSYATSKCALGHVLIARSAKGVCAILMGDDSAYLEADLAGSFPMAALIANLMAVQEDLAKVISFLERPADGIHLTLDTRGPPLQRRVWEKLRAISVGRTVTYGELARWISPLASPRLVAHACAANRIALAIPCHRVVAGGGDLCGYRWGVERKRQLIAMEGAV
jgi:methylated-DNA-[protein]-cysteine S-methyltransferase/AraC family transcriptional regulator of adaptative response/methylated-DNA-[protein]-cysteine methyltransferase